MKKLMKWKEKQFNQRKGAFQGQVLSVKNWVQKKNN